MLWVVVLLPQGPQHLLRRRGTSHLDGCCSEGVFFNRLVRFVKGFWCAQIANRSELDGKNAGLQGSEAAEARTKVGMKTWIK